MSDVFETAPSGRSKCRGCQQKIDKGELRYGEAVPNAFGSGEARHWYHLPCGAQRRSESFLAALQAHDGELPDRERLQQWAELGVAHPRWCRFARVERAASGRARCRHCREEIPKDSFRIAVEWVEDGMVNAAGFVHVGCADAYAGTTDALLDRLRRSTPDLTPADWSAIEKELHE